MKIRMYADVPQYYSTAWNIYASSNPGVGTPEGWTRVAFDVDFPPDIFKPYDVMAPVTQAQVIERVEK